jgi:aminomethyltransferase
LTEQSLLKTPLHDAHVSLGARMAPFAGYNMPIQYEGIIAEVHAVRRAAGMFDVSHMGRFFVDGHDGRALLDWVHTGDISESMPIGRARYGLICKRDGGIIDDGIVYRLSTDQYLLVANAANSGKVLNWLNYWRDERFSNARITDSTEHISMVAVQGPKAIEIISSLSSFDPSEVGVFRIVRCAVNGKPAFVARTGYTGEDGVEIMPHAEDAAALWALLIEKGVVPCGLGARDTLRLEAGLLLHGSDMDETVNPIEAGLERFVAIDREFCGSTAITSALENGTERQIIGFRTLERTSVPRSHSNIVLVGKIVGSVASGSYSPTLDMNIGLGYVPIGLANVDSSVQIDVRGKLLDAKVVNIPFYSRPR